MGTGGQQETAYLQCKVGRGQRGQPGRCHSPGGVTLRAVSQPERCHSPRLPLTVPNPAVCQRAEPVAVSPAQGVRQQPPPAPLLPSRRLPRRQMELLPPAGQDRYREVAPEPLGGLGGVPLYGDPAAPQGWGATGPGTASPCRTGVTPWTPRWRLSASSSTSRASGGPSGEFLPAGDPPAPPLQPLILLPRTRPSPPPLPREKYWELLEPEDAQNGPRGEGRL